MGETLMKSPNSKENRLLEEYGTIRACSNCEQGVMLPSTKTLTRVYKNTELSIANFPIFRCQECSEVTYSASRLLKTVQKVKDAFEDNGYTTFDFNNIS